MNKKRDIIFYKSYFDKFFEQLDEKTKNKVDEILYMITVLDRIPSKFLKKIKGIKDLFEVRIKYNKNIYRVFCCFDEGNLVVLFNGFQKKSQKTPQKELDKAERIMNEYLAYRQAGFKQK